MTPTNFDAAANAYPPIDSTLLHTKNIIPILYDDIMHLESMLRIFEISQNSTPRSLVDTDHSSTLSDDTSSSCVAS